jgi:hypothetical protein
MLLCALIVKRRRKEGLVGPRDGGGEMTNRQEDPRENSGNGQVSYAGMRAAHLAKTFTPCER